VRTYEAVFSRPESVARVQAARRAIERAGGRLEIRPPNRAGMVVVTLTLPDPYTPDDFVPGLPFALV
jgi:hypothetical protein